MKSRFFLLSLWMIFNVSLKSNAQSTSKLIEIDASGHLKYIPDARGNVIPDFSDVGYKNGEVEIPMVPVVKTISAVSGDNTSNIQTAIDAMKLLPLNSSGVRGTLLLKAGIYNVSGSLRVSGSGIVIRGEGSGSNGTILVATTASQYNLLTFSVSGGASAQASTSKKITDSYVAIGAHSFTVEAGHTFNVGDRVLLQRKPNQAWINMLGMDNLTATCATCENWTPAYYTMNYKRKVKAISGNVITLDAPVVDPIDSKYAEGFLMRYTWNSKIENVGVENIRFDSKYASSTDESHGWNAVVFSNTENGWVKNIESWHFGYSAVTVSSNASNISILDSKCMDPISLTEGGRKYSFNINGDRNLVKGCYTRGSRHDYVTGATVSGPNVFVNCTATNQQTDIGPHHRWSTGLLFDNIIGDKNMNVQNRETSGTGHGWAGAQTMFWNCTAPTIVVQSPPEHVNWAIGCKAKVTGIGPYFTGKGYVESVGTFVTPLSLYEIQLCERLSNCVQSPPVVTGVLEDSAKEIAVFPNPVSSGILNIRLPSESILENDKVQLINMAGQLILEHSLKNGTHIDVSDLAKGIYVATIQYRGVRFHKKIVIS